MRSMKKVFTENSVLQIDQGNLISTPSVIKSSQSVWKHPSWTNSRSIRRNLMSVTAQVHTWWGEQHALEVHREVALFNTDNEFNREINEEDIDFNIPGVPHSAVKQLHGASVRELIQKIENHPHRHALQRDLQQSQSFNPFSQESKQNDSWSWEHRIVWITRIRNPKHSAKYAYHTGTSASSTARARHFLRNGTEENKKFVQYTMDLLSIPNYYMKKGRLHRAPLREEARGPRVLHREFAQEEMQKRSSTMGIHDRFIRDEKFRKNMFDTGRTEEMCRKMDELANEDHTHHITPEEISLYRNNWWIRSNKVGSDTMPVRHRPYFQASIVNLATAQRPRGMQPHQQRWTQSYSSSWWNWQESWWAFFLWASPRRRTPALIDAGKPDRKVIGRTYSRYDSQN